jgi:hypothetical protein
MLGIPFLIDENVPHSVARFLENRGHRVRLVRELFPRRSPDAIISVIGDDLGVVVVTWDRDFNRLNKKLRKLGRLSFECDEKDGRALVEQYIDYIEFHYQRATAAGRKMMVTIQPSGIKLG